MKEITIFQYGISPLHISDNDDSNISEYTKKISSLLKAENVLILETTSGNIILRPHKISSIQVVEKKEEKVDNKPEEQVVNIGEDFITDGD